MEKSKKGKNPNPKKGKSIVKLINKSDSDSDDSEHELSYYLDDRVKLMKEVIKILKPKKIKSMAPSWMKDLKIEEINTMLFEELLGISNKRLKCIFNGQQPGEDSSSTDPEEEEQKQKSIDVISLDDVSDDDFVINLDSDEGPSSSHKKTGKVKVKEESKRKKIKKEKHDKSKKSKSSDKEKTDEQNLMSVLELLELQARARAIKSQLALENMRKAESKENEANSETKKDNSENEDAVIIESPKNIEIVITSSESENEESRKSSSIHGDNPPASTSEENDKTKTNDEVSQKTGDEEKTAENVEEDTGKCDEEDTPTIVIDSNQDKDSIENNDNVNTAIEHADNSANENDKALNSEENSESTPSTSKQTSIVDIVDSDADINKALDNIERKRIRMFRKRRILNKSVSKKHSEMDANSKKVDEETPGTNHNQSDKEDNPKVDEIPGTNQSDKEDNPKVDEIPGTSQSDKEENPKVQQQIIEDDTDSMLRSNSIDENEGIIINVDQSEIECIISD